LPAELRSLLEADSRELMQDEDGGVDGAEDGESSLVTVTVDSDSDPFPKPIENDALSAK
jgi:hypothetical protein